MIKEQKPTLKITQGLRNIDLKSIRSS